MIRKIASLLRVEEATLHRIARGLRMGSVVSMVLTGLFFITWPPMSTAAMWGGEYPPIVWGAFMIIGGGFAVWGIKTKIMQTEQTGMFILALAIAFYALNQALIMFQVPITPSRAGSTMILVSFLFSTCARHADLAVKIQAQRNARRLGGA